MASTRDALGCWAFMRAERRRQETTESMALATADQQSLKKASEMSQEAADQQSLKKASERSQEADQQSLSTANKFEQTERSLEQPQHTNSKKSRSGIFALTLCNVLGFVLIFLLIFISALVVWSGFPPFSLLSPPGTDVVEDVISRKHDRMGNSENTGKDMEPTTAENEQPQQISSEPHEQKSETMNMLEESKNTLQQNGDEKEKQHLKVTECVCQTSESKHQLQESNESFVPVAARDSQALQTLKETDRHKIELSSAFQETNTSMERILEKEQLQWNLKESHRQKMHLMAELEEVKKSLALAALEKEQLHQRLHVIDQQKTEMMSTYEEANRSLGSQSAENAQLQQMLQQIDHQKTETLSKLENAVKSLEQRNAENQQLQQKLEETRRPFFSTCLWLGCCTLAALVVRFADTKHIEKLQRLLKESDRQRLEALSTLKEANQMVQCTDDQETSRYGGLCIREDHWH